MGKIAISVTEAARNFADCVNRVRYQNMTFLLLKNGTPVARLSPDQEQLQEKTCSGADLAAALKGVRLTAHEKSAWRDDLEEGRKALAEPVDRWQS